MKSVIRNEEKESRMKNKKTDHEQEISTIQLTTICIARKGIEFNQPSFLEIGVKNGG